MTEYLSVEELLTLIGELLVGPLRVDHRRACGVTMLIRRWTRRQRHLLESLVRNHPLVDGNKCLGWLATVVFLDINGACLEAPDDDAYDRVIAVASGQQDLADIAQTLGRWH